MQIHTLVQDVRDQLDEPDSSYLTHDIIMRWLNQGQKLIARITKCLQDKYTISLSNGVSSYDLPANYGVESVFYTDNGIDYMPLRNLSISEMGRRQVYSNNTGMPEYYALQRQGIVPKIILMPVPEKEASLVVIYYRVPETMVCETDSSGNPIEHENNVDPEIPDEFQDILITWCRYKKLERQEDKEYRLARQEFYEEAYLARDAIFVENSRFEDEMYIEYY